MKFVVYKENLEEIFKYDFGALIIIGAVSDPINAVMSWIPPKNYMYDY